MTWLQALIMGVVQGLTEFLPVSSSAHLVLTPYLLGWTVPQTQLFIFDVLVQDATLVAVIIYFWKDLVEVGRAFLLGLVQRRPFAEPQARLGWYLILATIPAAVFGLLIKKAVEQAFASPVFTALALLVTAGLLLLAEWLGHRRRDLCSLGWLDSLWIGLFQAISIFPGISRSGSTISAGMLRELERPAAARFSFLMSVPVMLGAGGVAMWDMLKIPGWPVLLPAFIPGFIAAAVVGYLSIRWLIGYLVHRPLYVFSAYCTLLALLVLAATLR
jgi:undecaprenyl-diphosphatase